MAAGQSEDAMKELSKRQQDILEYIRTFLDENDYPPSIRDIQSHVNISSTSVVDYNLRALEQRNLIRRTSGISRGIELVDRGGNRRKTLAIPVIGQIAAGLPIPVPTDLDFAENDDLVELGADLFPDGGKDLFALRVKGLSMIDALIQDGDVVVLRRQETCENGDTVAVWLRNEQETTLKKFYLEGPNVRLQPANATMEPIYTPASNVQVQGRLVTVLRSAF